MLKLKTLKPKITITFQNHVSLRKSLMSSELKNQESNKKINNRINLIIKVKIPKNIKSMIKKHQQIKERTETSPTFLLKKPRSKPKWLLRLPSFPQIKSAKCLRSNPSLSRSPLKRLKRDC